MKVTGIDTYDLRIPTVKPMALEFAEHRVVAAVIHTDEGIDGLGYTLAFGGGGAESIQVYLETRLKPLILGEDPLFVERLWERMFRADRGIKRQGVAAYALSAHRHRPLGHRRQGGADCRSTSSGAPSPTACPPTAAAAGAATRRRT